MTQKVRDWLPKQAFTVEAIQVMLADTLHLWGMCWFGDKHIEPMELDVEHCSSSAATTGQIYVERHMVSLVVDGRGKRALLELVLQSGLEGATLSVGDHEVLNMAATRIVENLADEIDQLFDHGDSCARDVDHISVKLSLQGNYLLQIIFPTIAAIPLLKSKMAQTQKSPSLVNSLLALGSTEVTVEATLGQALLPFSDLQGLEVGDVLLLDQPITAPVALKIIPGNLYFASGELHSMDGRVAVRV